VSLRGTEKTWGHLPLRSLGVPPLAILAAFDNDRMIGLELSGDSDDVFQLSLRGIEHNGFSER